ncbi:MAG: SET domain-containing protein-lysine N-methyltransferase [Acidobacteriota bacterium]|nr:SET domain-containing protein-lysine N-methyltransferase [Acidobacteriota bacterium]
MPLAAGLTIKKSPINGKGCFATAFFPRRRKICEYAGELITNREAKRRARTRRKLRICAIDQKRSIDGSRGGNGSHYINHSCQPNAYMTVNRGHLLFISMRDIQPGEEITIDYQSTLHDDDKKCSCNAPSCRGTINK